MIYVIIDFSRAIGEHTDGNVVYTDTNEEKAIQHFEKYYAEWAELERDYIYEAELRAYEDGWNLCDKVPEYMVVKYVKNIVDD